eukprot:3113124-Amphidinium_carterae.1
MLLICGACCTVLSVFWVLRMRRRVQRPRFVYSRRLARVRSAWHEASQRQDCFLVVACCLYVLYFNMAGFACTVVSHHVRFHFLATGRPAEVYVVVLVHGWMCHSASRFLGRYKTEMPHLRRGGLPVQGGGRARRMCLAFF